MKNEKQRSCFESNFAAEILSHPELVASAVKKVSNSIHRVLAKKENFDFLLKNKIWYEACKQDLCDKNFYGNLEIEQCSSQPEELLKTIQSILQAKSLNLPLVMHLHHLFMQKIYNNLPDPLPIFDSNSAKLNSAYKCTLSQRIALKLTSHPEKFTLIKGKLIKKIFESPPFQERSRQKINVQLTATQQIGYAAEDCSIPIQTEEHVPACNQFIPIESKFNSERVDNELPFCAGPSGHTGSGLLAALLLGDLNKEELKQYILANIGTLTGGGYHTIHEIMVVVNRFTKSYEIGDYKQLLPDSFLYSYSYRCLADRFPQFLPPAPNTLQWFWSKVDQVIERVECSAVDFAAGIVKDTPLYISNKVAHKPRYQLLFFANSSALSSTPLLLSDGAQVTNLLSIT